MEPVRAAPVFMYQRVQREDVVRIPPERLGEDIDAVARELTRTTLEGKIGADKTLTLIASNIERMGEGRIVHGDGAVYQRVKYDALVFAPALQEIVEGTVVEILKFGAFVRFGPLDGLLHISQVMDDRVDVDEEGQRLIGKDTKRDLRIGDKVRTRIVAVSRTNGRLGSRRSDSRCASPPSANSTGSKRTARERKAAPGRNGEVWSSRFQRRARTVPRSRTRTSARCAGTRHRRIGKAT